MAISRLSFACRHGFHYSPSFFHCFQKVRKSHISINVYISQVNLDLFFVDGFCFIVFLQVRFSSVAAIETLFDQDNVIKDKNQNLGTFYFLVGLF
jgi:hypothetical protein